MGPSLRARLISNSYYYLNFFIVFNKLLHRTTRTQINFFFLPKLTDKQRARNSKQRRNGALWVASGRRTPSTQLKIREDSRQKSGRDGRDDGRFCRDSAEIHGRDRPFLEDFCEIIQPRSRPNL